MFFAAGVNFPAAYLISLGFESWFRSPEARYSKCSWRILLCFFQQMDGQYLILGYSPFLRHPWLWFIDRASKHSMSYGLSYSERLSCNTVKADTSGLQSLAH